MEWLKQQVERFRKEDRDWKNVVDHAERIYTAVWAEIVKVVNEAPVWDIELIANGIPLHHTVTMGKRVLKLDLADDRHSIIASRPDGAEVVLEIAVCPDGSVCVRCAGKAVTYAEAAQKIMEPFLFGGESPYAFRT